MKVYLGESYGLNIPDAEKRYRKKFPKELKGKKLSFLLLDKDPPFRIYDVFFETTRDECEDALAPIGDRSLIIERK